MPKGSFLAPPLPKLPSAGRSAGDAPEGGCRACGRGAAPAASCVADDGACGRPEAGALPAYVVISSDVGAGTTWLGGSSSSTVGFAACSLGPQVGLVREGWVLCRPGALDGLQERLGQLEGRFAEASERLARELEELVDRRVREAASFGTAALRPQAASNNTPSMQEAELPQVRSAPLTPRGSRTGGSALLGDSPLREALDAQSQKLEAAYARLRELSGKLPQQEVLEERVSLTERIVSRLVGRHSQSLVEVRAQLEQVCRRLSSCEAGRMVDRECLLKLGFELGDERRRSEIPPLPIGTLEKAAPSPPAASVARGVDVQGLGAALRGAG